MSTNRLIHRRRLLGAGGLAAASALGAGALGFSAGTAHAWPFQVSGPVIDGRLQRYHFDTPSVRQDIAVNVLLPEGYDATKRYPVLYLLHGGGGSHQEFVNRNIIGLTAGKELIVVMPDGGIAGWYCNSAQPITSPRNWETFHIAELLPWVDATFSTWAEYDGRALSGFSMGGFGALKYAAKYYGHFASVSCHSGPASLRRDFGMVLHWMTLTSTAVNGGPVYGNPWDEELISADNPVERIESYRNKRVFLVAGTERSTIFNGQIDMPHLPPDQFFDAFQEQHVADGQREFGALLDQAGIPHERYEEPGGHFVREHRLRQDIDGIIARLKKAG